ncbi:MAG: 23S rRNA (adenine(2503)-C(2))-methyltransferase RlmN [bacterium]
MEQYLKGLTLDELDKIICRILGTEQSSKPNFRTLQLLKWIYSKYQDDPCLFTDLSKDLRQKIAQNFKLRSLELVEYQNSKISESIKFAYKTFDGEIVESVLMKHPDRYTLCISSQVGCNVGCIFCASGAMGLKRNLHVHEIVEQFFLSQKFIYEKEGKRISNIVFMGMGEPLINYHNVVKAIVIFNSPWGFNISKRNITLSTSGIEKRIYDLVRDGVRVKLALSLHSPFQEQREKLIPTAKKYDINSLLKAVENYYQNTKKRITIEYILLKDINDTVEHAKKLVSLLKQYSMKVLINLIPYNSIGNVYFEDKLLEEPDISRIQRFQNIIKEHFEVSVRWSLGRDIDAACGQLRRKILSC